MFETLDKLMFAGLGALSVTRERAEEIFDEYVSRGKVEQEKRTGFIKEVMDQAQENRKAIEKLISKQVKETVDKLDLATKEDIKRLDKKLDQLLKKGQ